MPASVQTERAPSLVMRLFGAGRWQVAVLILTAIIGFVSWSPRLGDFSGYLQVGEAVLSGADIYRATPPGVNTWPPFFSLVCVPLALMARISTYLATSLWLLFNYLGVLLALGLLSRIVYDRRMTLRRMAGPDEMSISANGLLGPLLLTSTYIVANFEHVQINLLLFVLTLAGLYWIDTARVRPGALAIGAAAATKVMPVLILPYLALRRSWKALCYAGICTAVLSLSPILIFGWNRFWLYVTEWRRVLSWGWGVGAYNQSVYAMWERLLGHGVTPFTADAPYNLERTRSPAVMVAWGLSIVVAGLLSLRQFRITAPDHPRVRAAEWSVVLIGTAAFGPVAWKLYFVVLLLPNALLFALWRDTGLDSASRRIIATVLFGSALLQVSMAHDLFGDFLSVRMELGSAGTLSMLLMLGGVLWLRGRPDLLVGTRAAPV